MPSLNRGIHSFGGPARVRACAARMCHTRVLCGDWLRAAAPSLCEKWSSGSVGVFLDPPYGDGKMDYGAGGNGDGSIVADVWEWAERMQEHGHVRIVIAGYEGHPCLPGWREMAWSTGEAGGYSNTGNSIESRANCKRERLWFSPSCDMRDLPLSVGNRMPPRQPSLFGVAS